MNEEERLALAHALRTPLTSALMSTGLLASTRLTNAQRELLSGLEEDLLRLRLLIDRGLDLSRVGAHAGPMERQPLALGALVERISEPLRAQARERGIELSSTVTMESVVLADSVKLGWAISALLGNALRFARTSVTSIVRVRDVAELLVRDDGPGIAPERRAGLFSRDGTGLGLFLVQEIVSAHGGEIDLDDTSAAGTTFAVRLPLLYEEPHAETR